MIIEEKIIQNMSRKSVKDIMKRGNRKQDN